ncbi:MAG: DMT family transporter [Rhizobiaceae bacterium]|nr:DMT family transporter [Rhizobiaceae bacterium]
MTDDARTGIPRPVSRETIGLVMGLVGVTIFGGTLPATRVALAAFSPAFVTFGRAALAASLAAIVLVVLKRRFPRKDLKKLAFAGLMLVVGFPLLSSIAMRTVPAAHGGVVLGLLPLMTSIFATLFAGERPSPMFWVCGLVGAALVVAFALRDGHMALSSGDVALFLASLAASAGYVVSGVLARGMPGWEVICWALVIVAPLSFAGAAVSAPVEWPGLENPAWLGFFYLGVGSMFLGFFAWNLGLGIGGIARVSQVQLLQTFVTLAIASIVLGETITGETLAFAVAVVAVVALGRRARIEKRRQ